MLHFFPSASSLQQIQVSKRGKLMDLADFHAEVRNMFDVQSPDPEVQSPDPKVQSPDPLAIPRPTKFFGILEKSGVKKATAATPCQRILHGKILLQTQVVGILSWMVISVCSLAHNKNPANNMVYAIGVCNPFYPIHLNSVFFKFRRAVPP